MVEVFDCKDEVRATAWSHFCLREVVALGCPVCNLFTYIHGRSLFFLLRCKVIFEVCMSMILLIY